MTAYTTKHDAQCRHDDDQRITAHHNNISIVLTGYADGELVTDPFLLPADARTFARGILALADEVDGGEVEKVASDSRPKVGDRLRVTEDNPRHCPVVTGDVITVVGTDYDHDGADCVRVLHGDDSYRWFIPLTAVEKVTDEAEHAMPAAAEEPTVRGIRAGDRVRILVNDAEDTDVRVGDIFTVVRVGGILITVDDDVNGGYWYFREARSLEKVTDDAKPAPPAAAPIRRTRTDLLSQARDLMRGESYSAHDLIELADYLAGESA
ncbi:hypothetical protein [Streptomyces sp. NPDC002346]